jgi:hypothetical protein
MASAGTERDRAVLGFICCVPGGKIKEYAGEVSDETAPIDKSCP